MRTFNDPYDPDQDDLAGFIDRELRRLPELEAPPDLGDRILRHIRQQAVLPWWRRSFWEWPFPARLSASTLLMTLAVCVVWGVSNLSVTGLLADLQVRLPQTSPAWEQASGWMTQAQQFYQHGDASFWMWGGALLGTMMFLTVVGATTALLRLSAPSRRAA